MTDEKNDISSEIVEYLRNKLESGKQLTAIEWKTLNRVIDAGSNGFDDGGRFNSSEAVAQHYGVRRATILMHVRKGNIERNEDGTFNKIETDKYYVDKRGHKKKTIGGQAETGAEDGEPEQDLEQAISSERLRKLKAEADAKETLVEQMRGTLVPIKDVHRSWVRRYAIVRDGLLSLIDRMPPLFAGQDQKVIEETLRLEIRQLLKGFAKDGKHTTSGGD